MERRGGVEVWWWEKGVAGGVSLHSITYSLTSAWKQCVALRTASPREQRKRGPSARGENRRHVHTSCHHRQAGRGQLGRRKRQERGKGDEERKTKGAIGAVLKDSPLRCNLIQELKG